MRTFKTLVLAGVMTAFAAPDFAAKHHTAPSHPGAVEMKKKTEKTVEKTTEKTEAQKCDKAGTACTEGTDCKTEHCKGEHPQK